MLRCERRRKHFHAREETNTNGEGKLLLAEESSVRFFFVFSVRKRCVLRQ